jgi:hypothetical protein
MLLMYLYVSLLVCLPVSQADAGKPWYTWFWVKVGYQLTETSRHCSPGDKWQQRNLMKFDLSCVLASQGVNVLCSEFFGLQWFTAAAVTPCLFHLHCVPFTLCGRR